MIDVTKARAKMNHAGGKLVRWVRSRQAMMILAMRYPSKSAHIAQIVNQSRSIALQTATAT